jgi:hypothetical protein
MPITLTNLLTSGPLLVPLATGGTVRLSPRQTSAELPDVDATNNPTLDKLVQRGMVEVRRTKPAAARTSKAAARTSKSTASGNPPAES